MSRLPFIQRDALDETGQALWDSVLAIRGVLTNDGDGLGGPFNAWVTVPDIGTRLVDLGARLRFKTSFERRLLEIAILTIGARWHSEFEWWAHSRMARENGVHDEVIDAIAHGGDPPFSRDDERVVHAVANQLGATGRLDTATYEQGIELLGAPGLVELVTLCGYYTLVSFTLNAFDVHLPPGEIRTWAD